MKDFKVELIPIEYFYPTYVLWCKEHKFPFTKIGNIEDSFVCFAGEEPIYSTFFWSTKSKMCVMGFPVSNPKVSYKDRDGGLEYLIEEISNYAKEKGFSFMWTTSATKRVIDSLDKSGFILGDTNINQYVKILD
jgi:hypothetical protein